MIRHYILPGIVSLTLLGLSACSPDSPSGYTGISGEKPTGSLLVSEEGLIASYDMSTTTDEGLLRDFGSLAHHGRILGTTETQGLFGRARAFKTSDDKIDLPETDAFDLDGPISIMIWFRLTGLGLHQHILSVDDKFVFSVSRSNHLRFNDTFTNGIEWSTPLIAGNEYAIAVVFEGVRGDTLSARNIRMYHDGKPASATFVGQAKEGPQVWKSRDLYPSDAAYIGFQSHQGRPDHQTLQFEGVIDELLIFNRVLTEDEIAVQSRP